MNLTMNPAGLVLTILFTILMIYDLWLVVFRNTGSSLSTWFVNAGLKDPVIVAVFFFLFGHLAGYMYPMECPQVSSYYYDLGIFFIATGFGYSFGRRSVK